jgi:paraquat-inducible protein B
VSARAHPRAIGVFVLGAIALVLAAIVTLSSGDWFAARERFVVFFPGSVRGLSTGAPVTFRGIRLGEVKDVTALLTGKPDAPIQIEVVVELRRNVVEAQPGVPVPWQDITGPEAAKKLAGVGLRARLLSQSLLTGQKYIDLDFLPDEPARFTGIPRRYPELPTALSGMERLGQRSEALVDKLAELPIEEIVDDLRQALQSLHRLLDSPELRGALSSTRRSADAARPAIEDARAALRDLRRLADTFESQVRATGSETTDTERRLRQTLDRLDRTLGRIDETASAADETRVRAAGTLEELSRTLTALRNLADYVQTHPEALLLGKAKPAPAQKGEKR